MGFFGSREFQAETVIGARGSGFEDDDAPGRENLAGARAKWVAKQGPPLPIVVGGREQPYG
jgi:hypothetical protein